jgi:hypothetical protein
MTKQVQRRRGTATQHTSFTGAEGETSVNTTNKSVHVHDGSTAGGVEAARADLVNVSDASLNAALTGNTVAALTITTADINGGTIDGTVIGGATAAAVTGTAITGTSFTTTGDMSFGDDDKAIFGAGSDLQIYHDGSHSVIKEAGTGNLQFYADTRYQFFNADGSASYAQFIGDGGAGTEYVQLRYGNAPKLATTTTGVDVTGTITSDGLTVATTGEVIGTIGSTSTSGARQATLRLNVASTGGDDPAGRVQFTYGAGYSVAGSIEMTHTNPNMKFLTGTTERMRIDANGLEVTGTTGSGSLNLVSTVNATNAGQKIAFFGAGRSESDEEMAYIQGLLVGNSGGAGNVQAGHLAFGTFGAEAMRIGSSGHVGIGTSIAQSSILHVEDTGDTTLTVKALSSGAGNDDDANLVIDASGGGEAKINFSLDGAEKASIEWFNGGPDLNIKTASGTNGNIDFQPNESLAMRIDSSGNVGIGTSSSTIAATLHVNSGLSNLAGLFESDDAGTTITVIDNSTTGGSTAEHGLNAVGDQLELRAVDNLSLETAGSEAMRITSAGDVLIGTTDNNVSNGGSGEGISLSAGTYGGYIAVARSGNCPLSLSRLSNNGDITQFRKDGTVVGSISITGSATAYNTSSDYRLKEDWVPMSGASERVQALKPVNFAWKVDASRVDGFLAHELAEVIPEAVIGTKDAMRDEEYEVTPAVLDEDGNETSPAVMATRSVPDMQGIDQSKIVPLLTAALQEALTKIADLEARLTALEA